MDHSERTGDDIEIKDNVLIKDMVWMYRIKRHILRCWRGRNRYRALSIARTLRSIKGKRLLERRMDYYEKLKMRKYA